MCSPEVISSRQMLHVRTSSSASAERSARPMKLLNAAMLARRLERRSGPSDALGSSFELPHSPAIPSGPVATPRPSAGRALSSSSLDASVFAPHDVMTPRSSAGSAFSLGLLGSTIVEMPDDLSSISRQISVLSTDSALSTSYLDETIQNIPSSGSALSD